MDNPFSSGYICGLCFEEINSKDPDVVSSHISDKHKGIVVRIYNLYKKSWVCNKCNHIYTFTVPAGYGPDWVHHNMVCENCKTTNA